MKKVLVIILVLFGVGMILNYVFSGKLFFGVTSDQQADDAQQDQVEIDGYINNFVDPTFKACCDGKCAEYCNGKPNMRNCQITNYNFVLWDNHKSRRGCICRSEKKNVNGVWVGGVGPIGSC